MKRLLLLFALTWTTWSWAKPFRYAEDQAPGIINPIFATTMSEARINGLVFESLYADDQQLRNAPLLAESHEIASDGMSMTIFLRPGVSWHDGTPFVADDVVFTVRALQDPSTLSAESGKVRWIEKAESIDRRTVKLYFHDVQLKPQNKLTFKFYRATDSPKRPFATAIRFIQIQSAPAPFRSCVLTMTTAWPYSGMTATEFVPDCPIFRCVK